MILVNVNATLFPINRWYEKPNLNLYPFLVDPTHCAQARILEEKWPSVFRENASVDPVAITDRRRHPVLTRSTVIIGYYMSFS